MRKCDELLFPDSCLGKAAPDEPLFVLRSSDPDAPETVREWATRYLNRKAKSGIVEGHDDFPRVQRKANGAFRLADEMESYRLANFPE